MEIDDIKQKAEDLSDHVGDYIETYSKIALLNVTQKGTEIAATTLSFIAICGLGIFVLFFGGLGLAWWLGELLENRTAGFLIVAGFFALLIVIIVAMRKKIVFPYIRNLIIRRIYD